MSDITLSSGVRQNLLSLQQTATLLNTTQAHLATGKKVNSAFDNPSSFFTSQSLSNRASDLSSLLDQIGQAQQTLQGLGLRVRVDFNPNGVVHTQQPGPNSPVPPQSEVAIQCF